MDSNIECIGKIVFDKSVVQSMVEGKTIIEYKDSPAKEALLGVWGKIKNSLRN